jgi:predicted O-methyltransferase YrrM
MHTLVKALKYFVASPRYFLFYFLGRPERVLRAVTGEPERRYFELKAQLDSDPTFSAQLREKTSAVAKENFRLLQDHYFLYALVRLTRPTLILETGVFDGYFSACFLKGLHDNFAEQGVDGRLVSIDLPAYAPVGCSTDRYARRTRLPPGCGPGWAIPDSLRERWELHIGDSRELLPKLCRDIESFDLFFHDSLHTYAHMMFEFETVWPLLKSSGVLLTHDVHWNRAFRHFAKQHRVRDFAVHGFGVVRKH